MAKLMLMSACSIFRRGLSSLLKNECPDFEVVGEGSNFIVALDKIASLTPDILIIDGATKSVNGSGTIKTIHDKYPQVKILVLSDEDAENDFIDALKAGVCAYLLKTATFNEIVGAIRLVADGEYSLSPSYIKSLIKEFRNNNSKNPGLNILTKRELEIIQLAAEGASNKEIAEKLFIGITTVKAHFRNILGKMDVKNRTAAAGIAIANGLIKKTAAKISTLAYAY